MKKISVFAHDDVGKRTVDFLLTQHCELLSSLVVLERNNEIEQLAHQYGYSNVLYWNDEDLIEKLSAQEPDFVVLAWWPKIIKSDIINIPGECVVNFHPSYLPHNRGKNYNFWTIVEDSPFGVSLHCVNEKIDAGDVLFQQRIEKSWLDTGETLYVKAKDAIVQLFMESFDDLISGNYQCKKQNSDSGSFHWGKELHPASRIVLDKQYSARELLNLLRARTFSGYPACYFFDQGKKYEIRVSIDEIKD